MGSGLRNIFTPYKEALRTKLSENKTGYLEKLHMSITDMLGPSQWTLTILKVTTQTVGVTASNL